MREILDEDGPQPPDVEQALDLILPAVVLLLEPLQPVDAEAERLSLAPPRLVTAVFNDRFVGFKSPPANSAQKIARN